MPLKPTSNNSIRLKKKRGQCCGYKITNNINQKNGFRKLISKAIHNFATSISQGISVPLDLRTYPGFLRNETNKNNINFFFKNNITYDEDAQNNDTKNNISGVSFQLLYCNGICAKDSDLSEECLNEKTNFLQKCRVCKKNNRQFDYINSPTKFKERCDALKK